MKRFIAAFAFACACAFGAQAADKPYAIAIHGGAGAMTRTSLSPESESAHRAALTEALEAGRRVLAAGGTSLDAVTTAVRILEDSPHFNAGKGAVFTNEGTNELDASIMDGATLRAGAVAGVTTVKNPIEAARAVMEKSRHVLLAGKGADRFAKEQGLAIVDPSYFRTEERWRQFRRAKDDGKLGTVGAVALDRSGNLAAATSTGGTAHKRIGRVGDSPLIGAGTWAENDSVAVSATGTGEMFIRTAAAHDIAALVKYKGLAPGRAAAEALAKVGALGGQGGVIVLDRSGDAVFSFTTESMYRGFAKNAGKAEVRIFREGP